MNDPNCTSTHPRHHEEMSEQTFNLIRQIARSEAGLIISDRKKALVQSRLRRRVSRIGFATLESYVEETASGRLNGELLHMISALTTNVTNFFREPHHFRELKKTILPSIENTLIQGNPVRIWSAGCSSGEEPYTIALILVKFFKNLHQYDIKILATDIDIETLKTAMRGEFTKAALDNIPNDMVSLFNESQTSNEIVVPCQEVRELVSFRHLNLMNKWPMRRRFDVVFFRNVAIYFDQDVRNQLWDRFRRQLKKDGTLFLGHSERIANPEAHSFHPNGITQYTAI